MKVDRGWDLGRILRVDSRSDRSFTGLPRSLLLLQAPVECPAGISRMLQQTAPLLRGGLDLYFEGGFHCSDSAAGPPFGGHDILRGVVAGIVGVEPTSIG